MSTALEVLKKYWKYNSFREPQEEIINTVLNKQNTLAVLPTGAGKSLCYQVPALLLNGVCIVVSPLIALMEDQVKNLKNKGIKAVAITSNQTENYQIDIFDNLRYGGYKFLYLSPEKLQQSFIQNKIKQLPISLIAVDEAHCISEWGHNFRPSYLKINILKQIHPNTPIIAVTATATKQVQGDIINYLELENVKTFQKSIKRPEISYKIEKSNAILNDIKNKLKEKNEPAIVYTSSRKTTKSIYDFLTSHDIKSSYFHGGLTYAQKQNSYKNWLSEKTPVMVATNAFGMGIDKDNVSTIIHANLPFSLENYIQETGRVGRNGNQSEAILLYNNNTLDRFKKQFIKSIVSIDYIKDIYKKLNNYFNIAIGELPVDESHFNMLQFCKMYKLGYLKTYTAIDLLEKEGILEFSQNLNKKSKLKFIAHQNLLFNYFERNKQADLILKFLLRSYGGFFDSYKSIDESLIAKRLKLNQKQIEEELIRYDSDGIISYKRVIGDNTIRFLVPREDNYVINKIAKPIKQRYEIKKEKARAIFKFINNNKVCRSVQLLNYFNEENTKPCGECDVCKSKTHNNSYTSSTSSKILKLLQQENQLNAKEIIAKLNLEKNNALATLQQLLDNDKVILNLQQKFQLKIHG